MEISTFYNSIQAGVTEKGLSIDEALEIAYKNGITAIDISSTWFEKEDTSEFLELIEKHNIHISSVFAWLYCPVTTEEEYKESLKIMKNAADIAKKLKSKYLMAVPQRPLESPDTEDELYIKEYIRLFADLAEYGKQIGVQITVEDYSEKRIPYTSFSELDGLLDNIPELKFTYDSGNFPLAGIDEFEGAKRYAQKTVHIHLKDLIKVDYETNLLRDGQYYESVAIGDGYLKNKEALDYLKGVGYDGAVVIELCSGKDDFDNMIKSAKALKEML